MQCIRLALAGEAAAQAFAQFMTGEERKARPQPDPVAQSGDTRKQPAPGAAHVHSPRGNA